MTDAKRPTFYRGNTDQAGFDAFAYEEPGQGSVTFGEMSGIRMEGSDGTPLAVGIWRLNESTTSPVYTSDLGDETFLVLEGAVEIEAVDTGERERFEKGDICSWSKGTSTVWHFEAPFRKLVIVAGR